MYWRGSCSLCSINTAILCITAIPGDHYPDDGTPTHVLSVSLLLPNASIYHGSFDLNTNCKIPVFGVDSIIRPGLDSARYLNVTSNFRHRHPLSTQLISEPRTHANSYRRQIFSVFRCGGWRGSSWVFQEERVWREVRAPHTRAQHFPAVAHQALSKLITCYKVARGQGYKRCSTKPRNHLPPSKFWNP